MDGANLAQRNLSGFLEGSAPAPTKNFFGTSGDVPSGSRVRLILTQIAKPDGKI